MWHGARAVMGRLRPGRHLEVRTATAVTIEGDAPYQIDGDPGGYLPVEIRVVPERVQVIVEGSGAL